MTIDSFQAIVLKQGFRYIKDVEYSQGYFSHSETDDSLQAKRWTIVELESWKNHIENWQRVLLKAKISIEETPI